MKKEELERVTQLENTVYDWDKAQKIRNFADSLEKSITTLINDIEREKVITLITWIRNKADWIDPLISRNDELLDKKYDINKFLEDI